jgi:hypothetical protein
MVELYLHSYIVLKSDICYSVNNNKNSRDVVAIALSGSVFSFQYFSGYKGKDFPVLN